MSSTTNTADGSYAECDEFIDYQIQQARHRIKWTDLLTAMVLTGILLIGYVLVFTILDHWVVDGGFGAWTRGSLLAIVVAICAGIVIRYVILPWSRQIHPLFAARMLDKTDTGLSGALLSLIDLRAGGHSASADIQATLEKRAAVKLAEVNVDEAIDRRWLMRMGVALFVLVLLTCAYAIASPKAISLLRPLTFSKTQVATRTRILNVQPGNIQLAAGEQLLMTADVEGKAPEEVSVFYTTADSRFVDEPLVMQPTDEDGRYQVLMVGEDDRGIRQNLTYYIVAGDSTSDVFSVTVDQPPTASVRKVGYRYPDYMGLSSRTSDIAHIEAWEGTTISITAESTVPVVSALIELSDDPSFSNSAEEFELAISDLQLTGSFSLVQRDDGSFPAFYRITVEDSDGRTDPMPTVYSMKVREDKAPIVKLIDPIRDLKVPRNAVVPLLIEAQDPDFLLRSVILHYEINRKPVEPGERIFDGVSNGLRKSWVGTTDLDLKRLDVKPGDVVRYYVAARDNQPPLGNQGRSGMLQLEIQNPVSQEKADERLQEDRELQEQKLKERLDQQAAQNAGSQADGVDEDEPDKSSDETNDSGEPVGDDAAAGGATEPEASGDSGDGDSTSENSSTGETQSSEQPGERSDGSATDNEALHRILEQYENDSADAGTEDSGSPEDGSNGSPDGNSGEAGQPDTNQQPESDADQSDDRTNSSPAKRSIGNGDRSRDPDVDAGNSSEASTDNPGENSKGASPESGASDKTDPGQGAVDDAQQNGNSDTPGDGASTDSSDEGTDGSTDQNMNENGNEPDPNSGEPEGNPSEGNPSEGNPSEGNPSEGNPSEGNPSEGNPSEGNPSEGNPSEGNPSEGNPSEGNPSEGNPSEGNPSEGNPSEGNPSEGNPSEGNPSEGNPSEGNPSEGNPSEGNPSEGNPSEGNPSEGNPSEGNPSEGNPSEGGDSQGSGSEGGGSQGGGSEGGGSQGGGSEGGGSQGGGSEGGGSEGGGSEGGGSEGGGSEGGGSEGGGSEGGGSEGGGSEGGGSEGGGSEGGGSEGGGSQGGGSEGGGSQGGSSEGGGGQGGGQGGGSQGGGGSSGGAKGSGGSGRGAGPSGAPVGRTPVDGQANDGQGVGAGDNKAEGGQGGNGDSNSPRPGDNGGGAGSDAQGTDENLEDAAKAASLALRRLQQDLERGQVDQDLLKKLGWTEDQLRAFSERMDRQLKALEPSENESMAEKLQRRRMEETLKNMTLNGRAEDRRSDETRDRELQDTEVRRSDPPARRREKFETYQRSVIESGSGKP